MAVVMLIVGVMQEVRQCGGGGDVDSGVCEKCDNVVVLLTMAKVIVVVEIVMLCWWWL